MDSDNWLQFDQNQEFVSVPLESDVDREEYQLVCSDNEGYSSIDGIEVSTLSRPFSEKFNEMFVFVFNDTLVDGTKLSRSRVRLLMKLARMFRDEDTQHIVLSKVGPCTMELTWYNKTFYARDCPVVNIVSARRFLLKNDGSVRPRIVRAFEPTFHLSDIKMLMLGNCQELEAVPAPRPLRPHLRPAAAAGVHHRLRGARPHHCGHAAARCPHHLHAEQEAEGGQAGHALEGDAVAVHPRVQAEVRGGAGASGREQEHQKSYHQDRKILLGFGNQCF